MSLSMKRNLSVKVDTASTSEGGVRRSSSLSHRRGVSHPNLLIINPDPSPSLNQLSISSPDRPSEILPFFYLGCEKHTHSAEVLKEMKISAILNVAKECERKRFEVDFEYRHEEIADNFEEDIMKHFKDCFEFIDKIRNSGGKILVHCTAGKSRSPTIAMAYLIYSEKWTLRKAYEHVKEKRTICPNLGFLCILAEFEKTTLGERNIGLTGLYKDSLAELHILVAEDDEGALKATLQVLDRLNYKYDIAENGEMAIRKVIDTPSPYDLVLMDVSMPVMNGVEATKQIRQLEQRGVLLSKTIIFMLGSEAEVSDVAGIDAIMEKPIQKETFEEVVKETLKRNNPSTTESS